MLVQYCKEFKRWVIIKDNGEAIWPQHSQHLVQILNTHAALGQLERGDVYEPSGEEPEWVKDYEQWHRDLTRQAPRPRQRVRRENDSISLEDLGL